MDSLRTDADRVFSHVANRLRLRGPRIPRATYRMQFNRDFTFDQAAELAPYLSRLGVSELYASPFFKARPESMHGYDIVDHNRLNPAIGTREAFDRLSDRLAQFGLGLLVDFVPNHMGIGTDRPGDGNSWWDDVLENGPSSRYAGYFDVAWSPLAPELANKVLLPVLGDHYGRVLERGELKVGYAAGGFHVAYWQHVFPLNPRTYPQLLEPMLPPLLERLGEDSDHVLELQSIITGLGHLPPRTETKRARLIERNREKEILKRRLGQLVEASNDVQGALTESLARVNGTVGDRHSFDALDQLLEAQAYRLSYWRVAAEEINYRRFFDVNDLAAIRMEQPAVFAEAHKLLFELLAEGRVTGLRIDHPDGLWDPGRYFRDLQRGYFLELARRELEREQPPRAKAEIDQLVRLVGERFDALVADSVRARNARQGEAHPALPGEGDREGSPLIDGKPLYLVIEKILSRGELLEARWPVHGTSGYEFATQVAGVFVDTANARAMTELYTRFTDEATRFEVLARAKKRLIIDTALASEHTVLAHALHRIAERNRYFRDFTLGTLQAALREVIACFPVYRTYVAPPFPDGSGGGTESICERDRVVIDRALKQARRRSPTTDPSVYDFLRRILLLEHGPDASDEEVALARDFVMRFQQLTGPVVAKGLEDTAFYVYNRLVALNEVGGDPERFGSSLEEFHAANEERQRAWPHALLATSTHDTKRAEDVRARITVLSEIPEEWAAAVGAFREVTAACKTSLDGDEAPDRNEEYLFYQTLVGSWPQPAPTGEGLAAYAERIVQYMRKATKEAKVNTSWTNSNEDWDAAVERFVRASLAEGSKLLPALDELVGRVAFHGRWNAIAQALLKLTSPGVPDLYQGNELWDLSLVDPDNRRPVDFRQRRALLDEVRERRPEGKVYARELVERAVDGRIKLLVTHAALVFRRDHERLFGASSQYAGLTARGRAAEHAIAFSRREGDAEMVVVVPRLTVRLAGGKRVPPVGAVWRETTLPVGGRRYYEHMTGQLVAAKGGALALDEVLADFPVALLERRE